VRHVIPDQQGLGVDDAGDLDQEVDGCAIVNRDDNDPSDDAAPIACDPLGPVLAPEDDCVALMDWGGCESRAEVSD
jgi:hypothetical protein